MKNPDVISHVTGTSQFIDDFPVPQGALHLAVFDSTVARGKIVNLNCGKALEAPGIAAVITAKDIPGKNEIGNIISDETVLADGKVEYVGEPIAIIAADTSENAKAALKLIELEINELPAITDPRKAYIAGNLIATPQIFSNGDVDEGFAKSDVVVEGRVDIGGQEHLYLETQGALAVPSEDEKIKIYSSTQSPTAVQRAAAKVLGIPMHKIETDVLRLGGGFGGKEDQATPWAVMTALVARLTGKPAKLILSRSDDLRMTGKRHPYSADYKIGLSRDGKILAYEATYYQNAGACADLSTAILERTLFHATNSYFIPNVKTTGISCKTNLPPNTAFRGFGGPQGIFVMETAIYKAAEKLGVPAYEIQKKNLLKENDSFYYGQKAERVQAERCWNEAVEEFNIQEKFAAVKEFNEKNDLRKKGVALMPICFGISFTSSFLNQASALVHVYTDGSVGVSTAAVEMGQGVNEKIRSVVSQTFSISQEKVKMETTNTTRVANASPTAASSGADLNGNAALLACNNILNRLKIFAAESLKKDNPEKVEINDEKIFYDGKETEMNWESFINDAYFNRISLTSHAFYATPEIYFDRTVNKGRPFAYHVYGTAIITAEVDILRGVYEIESVDVVHDFGKSINRQVDLGQVEGAVVQGIGWLTMEELVQNDEGKLLSNSLSTYKIPDIFSAPKEMNVKFLEDSENPFGPLNSKAIGEPPFMYGIGAYFAIMNAMKEYNPNVSVEIRAPITHERVLMSLKNNSN